jgi:hypothetical protein
VRILFTGIVLDIKYEVVDYCAVLAVYGFRATGMFWNKTFHRIKFSIILSSGFIFPRFYAAWLNRPGVLHPMVVKAPALPRSLREFTHGYHNLPTGISG